MEYNDLLEQVAYSERTGDIKPWLQVIPTLATLISTPQDPYYHREGDVWAHTQMVINALLEQVEYHQITPEQRFILFMAALLHDIAKPETTIIDKLSGRIGQPGHSRKGAIKTRILLWQMGVPFELREQICRLISVHQTPFYALKELKANYSPEFLVHKLSWELSVWMLCCLAKADMQGRICEDKQAVLDDIELFKEFALEQQCLYQARPYADTYTRIQYLRGTNVALDYSLYPEQGSEVIVLSGLPATGKNHWVTKYYPSLPVASYDDARQNLKLCYGQNEGRVTHFVLNNIKTWLRSKQPFIWNATHLSREMRSKALDLLYAYQANVRIVYLEQPEKELYTRNNQRDTTLTNKKIQSMFYKWEVPLPTEAQHVNYIVNGDTY